mgnify:CR=1 FL=1
METAKVFKTGRSQAVRIPKRFRFNTNLVTIRKHGDSVILTPVTSQMTLEKFLAMPPIPDFKIDRDAGLNEQKRELF